MVTVDLRGADSPGHCCDWNLLRDGATAACKPSVSRHSLLARQRILNCQIVRLGQDQAIYSSLERLLVKPVSTAERTAAIKVRCSCPTEFSIQVILGSRLPKDTES